MKTISLSLVALFAASTLSLATASADDKADMKAMNGSWQIATATIGGKKLPEQFAKSMKLILKDGTYVLKSGFSDDSGTVKIKSDAKPKQMDITGTSGANKGKTFPAIYKVGKDSLTICYNLAGKTRPKKFESTAGTKLFLAIYKRAK